MFIFSDSNDRLHHHQFIKSHEKRTCLQLHEYKHNTNMIQCKKYEI